MKKIILLVCCMVLFSITACRGDADIDKLKGCWKISFGGPAYDSLIEIGDDYEKNLNNGAKLDVIFENSEKYILMRTSHPEIKKHAPNSEKVFYINKESITDTSFRRSYKASSPEDGLKFTRIQCPK